MTLQTKIVWSLPLFLLSILLAACAAGRSPAPAITPTAATPTVVPVEVAPTGPITITFWETDADDADVLLDELATAFHNSNPTISVKRVHLGYDDLRNEFRAQAFNGKPPELVPRRASLQGRLAN